MLRGALPMAMLATTLVAGCTLFLAGDTPCDTSADCSGGLVCEKNGFCGSPDIHGVEGEGVAGAEGEGGEGEGVVGGEGEGAPGGEGEGGAGGEGEGAAGGEGEGAAGGEGEGAAGGEGEGAVGGEGEGEGGPTTITLCGQQHVEQAWAAPTFPHRVPIGLCDNDANTPNEDVIGLPVTLSLTSAAFPDLDLIEADGRDVLFFDDAGNPLPYERQLYVDNASGVWNVRVPRFNPRIGADAIWMYFGSGDGQEHSNAAAAFPDYSSVWHFESGALLVEARSGATLAGNGISGTGGLVGGGVSLTGQNGPPGACSVDSFVFLQPFNGNGQAVPPPTPPSSAAASFSLLAAPRSFSTGGENGEFTIMFTDIEGGGPSGCLDNRSICALFFNDATYQVFAPNAQNHKPQLVNNGPPNDLSSPVGTVPLNVFKHSSMSWSNTGIVATFDGNTVVNSAVNVNAGFAITNVILGMAEQDCNGSFNGVFDEVRISNGPRAASFYRAESKAFAGTLLQRGAVETGP